MVTYDGHVSSTPGLEEYTMGYDRAPLIKILYMLQMDNLCDHSGCGKGRSLPQLSTNL